MTAHGTTLLADTESSLHGWLRQVVWHHENNRNSAFPLRGVRSPLVQKTLKLCNMKASPPPALAIGDNILWRGRRAGERMQTLVVDQAVSVEQIIPARGPGYHPIYHPRHDHSVREGLFRDPHPRCLNDERCILPVNESVASSLACIISRSPAPERRSIKNRKKRCGAHSNACAGKTR